MPTIRRFGSVNAAIKSGLNPHHYREVYPKELLSSAGKALPLIWCGKKAFTKYSDEECAKIDADMARDRQIRELQFRLRHMGESDPQRVELVARLGALMQSVDADNGVETVEAQK